MLVRSAERLIASLDAKTLLPMASSDYWELVERSVTLGTAASVLAGLRSATEVLPLVGRARAGRANRRPLPRRWPLRCTDSSGPWATRGCSTTPPPTPR